MIVDFGLAKVPVENLSILDDDARRSLTQAGVVMGTVAYMAPEAALGMRNVDRRADLYAVGLILYEPALRAGTPSPPRTRRTCSSSSATPCPQPIRERSPGVEVPFPVLEQVVFRLLEKDPDARYPQARALTVALEAALQEMENPAVPPVVAWPPSPSAAHLPPLPRGLRRRARGGGRRGRLGPCSRGAERDDGRDRPPPSASPQPSSRAAGRPGDESPGAGRDASARVLFAARALHPGIPLDAERFVRHLAHHRPEGAPLEAWLGSICAGDLYLACACAEGMPAAAAALHRQYRAQAGAYLSGMRPSEAFVEDVAQAVLERLLVGSPGSPPRIAEYSGRGALGSWLRVVTVRLALDLRRRRTEELAGDAHRDEPANAVGAGSDPEVLLLQRRYLGELNAALGAAVGALTGDQRSLLRAHFVEGVTLEQLAAARGVHRATVVRWIAAARQDVLAGARRQLGEKLQVRPAELESLMGMMRSRLDLSLSSAFPPG